MLGFLGQHIAKIDYSQHSARVGSGSGQKSMDFHLGNYTSLVMGGKVFMM